MFSHIALILSEKTASLAVSSLVDNDEDIDTKYLTDGNTPVSEMGNQGTGGPWWIWIIVGVLVFALCACLGKFKVIYFLMYYDNIVVQLNIHPPGFSSRKGFGMYRKKTGYYDKNKEKLPIIQEDVATDDGLDEPFLSAVDTPSIL